MQTNELRLKDSGPAFHSAKHAGIVITSDELLRAVAKDPDEKVKGLDFGNAEGEISFCEYADRLQKQNVSWVTFFHDYFFGGNKRELGPTHPEFIDAAKVISEECKKRGMGIGASIINPLDLGRDFLEKYKTGGIHRVYFEGLLDEGGSFSFAGYMPKKWTNNKGPIELELSGLRLFSFEAGETEGDYTAVPYDSIAEIKDGFGYEAIVSEEAPENTPKNFENSYIKISGSTKNAGNRVLAVLHMATPEMDYFHPEAQGYINGIIDMYNFLGIQFREFYSDEMHIQFDWDFAHFGPNEIQTRYMTDSFERLLAKKDMMFSDFDKLLVYFCNMTNGAFGGSGNTQHVMGTSPKLLYKTFAMRKAYFETLQKTVVELIDNARKYSEELYGFPVRTLGHATWQESPTCDKYHKDGNFQAASKAGASMYDYTPDFVYSSSIREAISACYDYFAWNDYYSGGGNDFCECGWFDRNYHGGAMTASFAALNRYECCYWGAWGFPGEAGRRFHALSAAYGAGGGQNAWVNEGRMRICETLVIYPKDLLYCNERFGSWTVQYGYANYMTAEKFESEAKIEKGRIYAGCASYSSAVVAFEPFATDGFIKKLGDFAESGGTVLWSSVFPVCENGYANPKWEALFGAKPEGAILSGEKAGAVSFGGIFEGLADMAVLTDFLVDRAYAIKCADSEPVAYIAAPNGEKKIIGSTKKVGTGRVCYTGCRLRDDQSKSTGGDISTFTDILYKLGAFSGEDDANYMARKGEYYFARFENGAKSASVHTREISEDWEGGFFRNKEKDEEAMAGRVLPSMELKLDEKIVEGDKISYSGEGFVFWRAGGDGGLEAFTGYGASKISINGTEYKFADGKADISFAPLHPERLPDGYENGFWLYSSVGKLAVPNSALPKSGAKCFLNASGDGRALESAEAGYAINGGNAEFAIPDNLLNCQLVWLW
ncbi:MAG: hypothetical protein FWG34_04560 [Oscillospiraceae bacterium]|nr:hypothetical protein [Oscillospiraceae bacterium]